MQLNFDFNDSSNTPVTAESSFAFQVYNLMKELIDRRHHIEAALEYTKGTHTFDDICKMVLNGRLMWFALPNSFMALEFVNYPQETHLHGFLAGGNLEEIKAMQPRLEAIARDAGCSRITLSGRRGWVKALKQEGWQEDCTSISLAVSPHAEKTDGQKRRVADDRG